MRRKLLPLILGGALSIAAVAPAAAQDCTVQNDGRGGAAALVALINANVSDVGLNVCHIDVLNNSLNNLLRNADIDVLTNFLNNSPILSGFTITVQDIVIEDVLSGIQVNVFVLSAGVPIQVGELTFDLPPFDL